MSEIQTELSPDVTAEIERHKYFLSEKAGYDVGWEHARQDWFEHHAAADRDHLAGSDCRRVDSSQRSVPRSGFGRLIKRVFSRSPR